MSRSHYDSRRIRYCGIHFIENCDAGRISLGLLLFFLDSRVQITAQHSDRVVNARNIPTVFVTSLFLGGKGAGCSIIACIVFLIYPKTQVTPGILLQHFVSLRIYLYNVALTNKIEAKKIVVNAALVSMIPSVKEHRN